MYARMLSLVTALLFTASANASVIFEDNFDSELNPGVSQVNYSNFANWTVSNGTVDLVSNGGWGIDCYGGAGKCVDLDGSNRNAGVFTSTALGLDVGTYELSFALSGNQRNGSTDAMVVSLGGLVNADYTLAGGADWEVFTHSFTVGANTADSIVFNHNGGDNIGIMLDNVSLRAVDVPEPATLVLLGFGLLGLRAARKS